MHLSPQSAPIENASPRAEHIFWLHHFLASFMLAGMLSGLWFALLQSWVVAGLLFSGGMFSLLLIWMLQKGENLSLLLLLFSVGLFLDVFALIALSETVAVSTPFFWSFIILAEGLLRGKRAAVAWFIGLVAAMAFLWAVGFWPRPLAANPTEALSFTLFAVLLMASWLRLGGRFQQKTHTARHLTEELANERNENKALRSALAKLEKSTAQQTDELVRLKSRAVKAERALLATEKAWHQQQQEVAEHSHLMVAMEKSTGIAYATLDLGLNIMYCGVGMENLLRQKRDDKKVLSYREQLSEASQKILDTVPSLLESGQERLIEQKHTFKHPPRVVEATFNRVDATTGHLDAILMTLRDTSQLEAARKNALKWENTAQVLLANAHSMVVAWSATYEILWVNPFAERVLGRKSAELKGKEVAGNLFPIKIQGGYTAEKMLEELRLFPENFHGKEVAILNADKQKTPVVWNMQPVYGEPEDLLFYLAIGTHV